MKEKILDNLEFINDKNNLKDKLDLNLEEFVISEYNKLFLDWKKEYNMFDIPSGVISISVNDKTNYINVGKNKYDENTIFDIASMTKIYTEFILFDVLKDYNLSLDTKIKDITSLYEKINELTLMDLISFNNTYLTIDDMRVCTNKKDALTALRTSYILEDMQGKYLYTDLPIMILTDILEEYTHMSYFELFEKYILKKYNLKDTYLVLDDNQVSRYVSINGKYVNDPKANIFGGYYGHAGVKSSSKDFIKFLNHAFDSKYNYLFTEKSKTLNSDNKQSINKSLIGNFNLSVPIYKVDDYLYTSLASDNLPKRGIAIQGSVRCHAETCIFRIDNKEYKVSFSIFLDLYTQENNIHKYEKIMNKKITSEHYVDGIGSLKMIDVRSLLSYQGIYKKLTNMVGIARMIMLYNYIENMI